MRRKINFEFIVMMVIIAVIAVTAILSIEKEPEIKYVTKYKTEYVAVIQESPRFKTMEVTAYTAGYESTQKKKGEKGYGITASGNMVKDNHTAACPPNLPFGTELFIVELHRVYVCEDRGGAIKGNHIDIFMSSLDEAKTFGRKSLTVLINM